jgi:hypothetical protein
LTKLAGNIYSNNNEHRYRLDALKPLIIDCRELSNVG